MAINLLRYLPSIIWMSLMFFLSAQSTIGIGQTRTQRFLILKSFHLIEYAILYLLLYLATGSVKKAVIISYSYALSDEIHQSLVPGREGKFLDTLIDLIGILIGLVLGKIFLYFYKKIPIFSK